MVFFAFIKAGYVDFPKAFKKFCIFCLYKNFLTEIVKTTCYGKNCCDVNVLCEFRSQAVAVLIS